MISLFLLSLLFPYLAIAQTYGVYSLNMGNPNLLNVYSGNGQGLTWVKAVGTSGNGVPNNGPGLSSQNALIASGNYLFGVNPTSNTVSMFSIDTTDPTLVTLVGNPAPSGGDWPLSVTAYGNTVCVANSGVNNGIRCFTYDYAGLTVLAGSDRSFGLNLTLPPMPATGPAQISFTPDGKFLVVSIKSANPPFYLWTFQNGVLGANAITASPNGKVPFGFTFDTDGTLVLTDAAPTGTTGGIALVNLNATSITYLTPQYFLIPNQNAACWVSRSQQTGDFYVANAASSSISEIARNGNVLTVKNTFANISRPIDNTIITWQGQDYLFQLSVSQRIYTLRLSDSTLIQALDIKNANYSGGIAGYVPTAAATSKVSLASSQTYAASSQTYAASSQTKVNSGVNVIPNVFVWVVLSLLFFL